MFVCIEHFAIGNSLREPMIYFSRQIRCGSDFLAINKLNCKNEVGFTIMKIKTVLIYKNTVHDIQ